MAQIGQLNNYEIHRSSIKSETNQTMAGAGHHIVHKTNPRGSHPPLEGLEETSYICGECGRSFEGHLCFTDHQKTHKEKIYTCAECRQSYKHETALNRHIQSHTVPEPYRCIDCHQCFGKNSDLVDHQQCHRGEIERAGQCAESGLCQPEQAAHQGTQSGETCEISASRKRTLRTLTQEDRCSQSDPCIKSLSDTLRLDQHQKAHEPLTHTQCHTCYQHFHKKADLARHEKKHTGVKAHTCPHCRSSFRLKSSLTLHMKIHRNLGNPD